MFKTIISFLMRHKKTKAASIYISTFVVGMYLFSFILNYYITKEFIFDYEIWIMVFSHNLEVILAMYSSVLVLLIIFIIFLNEKYKIIEKKNSKHEILLKTVAAKWTKTEIKQDSKAENNESEPDQKLIVLEDVADESVAKHIFFQDKYVNRFYQTSIYHNISMFTSYEFKLILEILGVLNKYNSLSSIPSYGRDNEFEFLNSIESLASTFADSKNGDKNYELLKVVNIARHTVNVADAAILAFKDDANKHTELLYPSFGSVVISALAHDIGKITPYVCETLSMAKQIVEDNSHVGLSVEVLQKIGKEYPRLQSVLNAISSHHLKEVPSDILGKMIFLADKSAREKESKEVVDELSKKDNSKKPTDETQNNVEENKTAAIEHILEPLKKILKNTLFEFDTIDENSMPIMNMHSKYIHVYCDGRYVYFDPKYFKVILENIHGSILEKNEFHAYLREFSERNIITKNHEHYVKLIKFEMNDLDIGEKYMILVPCEVLGIQTFEINSKKTKFPMISSVKIRK